MQWLQDPNQSNVDNLKNIRHGASRHCRNKKKKYLIDKIDELETVSKIKNISGFKKGYQPRTNIVKDENDDLITDSYNILARWRNHFSQLLMHMVLMMLGRQKYTQQNHRCLSRVPLRLRWLLRNLKRHKSRDFDEVPTDLIEAGGRTGRSEIPKLLMRFGVRRNCLRSGRSRSLYLSISRTIKQILVIIEAYHLCQLRTKFYPTSCCQG